MLEPEPEFFPERGSKRLSRRSTTQAERRHSKRSKEPPPPKEERRSSAFNFAEVFEEFDKKRTGALDLSSFHALLVKMKLELSRKEVKDLMRQVDADGDGYVQLEEFEDFFSAAKSREEIKAAATASVKDKSAWVAKLYGEFKDKKSDKGVAEPQLLPLCAVLRFELNKVDLYDIFYAIVNDTLSKRMVIDKIPALADQLQNRKRSNNTHMDKADLYMFLETASFREDLKAFLGEQPDPGPDAFDLRIQHLLFDHLADYEKQGKGKLEERPLVLNGDEFKTALDMLAPYWPPQNAPSQPTKKRTKETIESGNKQPFKMEVFTDYFDQVKGTMETLELVEDFDRSDPVKNKANGIVAGVMVLVMCVGLLLGAVLDEMLFFAFAGAAGLVAVYLVLYIYECTAIDFPYKPKEGVVFIFAGLAQFYFAEHPVVLLIPEILRYFCLVLGGGLLLAAAGKAYALAEQRKAIQKNREAAAVKAQARKDAVKYMDKKEAQEAERRRIAAERRAPDGELEIVENRRMSLSHIPPEKEGMGKKITTDGADAALARPSLRPGMSAEELAELGLPGQVGDRPEWSRRNSKASVGTERRGSKASAAGGRRPSKASNDPLPFLGSPPSKDVARASKKRASLGIQ